jgi:hypothetical protein
MSIEELELQEKLAKALADADYWRLAYDKLLSHMEHNNQYIQHLEKQIWGSR